MGAGLDHQDTRRKLAEAELRGCGREELDSGQKIIWRYEFGAPCPVEKAVRVRERHQAPSLVDAGCQEICQLQERFLAELPELYIPGNCESRQ